MHLIYGNYPTDFKNISVIYFSMGCFWSSEKVFWNIDGVVFTEVGYCNPTTEQPSCADVFNDKAFHREVVKVFYDSKKVDIEDIVKVFFENHVVDFDLNNVPVVYRSAIFYENHNEVELFEKYKNKFESTRKQFNKDKRITTEFIKLITYLPASESHQQYILKHKDVFCYNGFCGISYQK